MFVYLSGESVITEDYEGRLEAPVSPGTTKNVSVVLKNMQVTDSGLYTCDVNNFPDVEGTTEANIKVTVLRKLTIKKLKTTTFYTMG